MPIALNLSKSEPDERLLVDFLHVKLAYRLSRADDFNTLDPSDDDFSSALVHLVGISTRYSYSFPAVATASTLEFVPELSNSLLLSRFTSDPSSTITVITNIAGIVDILQQQAGTLIIQRWVSQLKRKHGSLAEAQEKPNMTLLRPRRYWCPSAGHGPMSSAVLLLGYYPIHVQVEP